MKRLPWFRMFYEARNDAKLRTLSDRNFRIWFNLLCLAAEQGDRGEISAEKYPGDLLAIEVSAGDEVCLKEALYSLERLRIISRDDEGITFIHFMERQYDKPSDYPENTRARKQKERDNRVTEEPVTPLSRDVTPNHAQEKRRIEEIREEKRETPPAPSPGEERVSSTDAFDIFWTAYPRKENKPGALRAWKKLRPDALLVKCIHTGLVAWKESDQWQRGIVPHAQTWLNARQWEDEPFAAVRAPNGHAEPVTFQQQIAINNRRNGEQFLAAVERHQNRGQQDVPDGDEQARRLLPHGG